MRTTPVTPSQLDLRPFFAFFFLSGASSLIDEVVWLRLAMARFGVTTPLVSIVLSVFMAGLALGSWGAGRLARRGEGLGPARSLRLYALAELLIGLSALVVPWELEWGRRMLASATGTEAGVAWASTSWYAASGAIVVLALLPFCACMGATFPLAMSALRGASGAAGERSFSYLYLANVAGACAGTLASAFVLIELLGFRRTLLVAALLNALVCAGALVLSRGPAFRSDAPARTVEKARAVEKGGRAAALTLSGTGTLTLLFLTGLSSLAMEVIWIRQFTPYLGPLVYSFALVLAIYLASTALGSSLYRRGFAAAGAEPHGAWPMVLLAAGASSALPLLGADPRIPLGDPLVQGTMSFGRLAAGALRLALGIAPFCAALGFLTPLLVDRWAAGDPERTGRAYAVNVLGCIAGPLLAGFLLLPLAGERWSLLLLALLLVAAAAPAAMRAVPGARGATRSAPRSAPAVAGALGLVLLFLVTRDTEALYPGARIRRDYTATVIAADDGMDKHLLINGYGITSLTPITKMMAHLPMAFLTAPPRSALALCFGMGTSFRSLLSWDVPTTAVELVPSVPSLFGYFHADGERLLRSPLARVVIDDGRRFLEREPAQYDVITVDPPPPVEAAGSSLLYSRDFYVLLRRRLQPGGVVQQWLPWGDPETVSSMAKALREAFPHVRVFGSVEGWGMHFLASASPIPRVTARDLAARLPPHASSDLVEWGPYGSAEMQFEKVLRQEMPVESLIALDPQAPVLEDDRPVNEYYLLRRLLRSSR